MTTSLGRQLENCYIVSYIEGAEAGIEITFDFTWISNLNITKKIEIRRIASEIDPQGDYQLNLQTGYSTKQDSSYYIYDIEIDLIKEHKRWLIYVR
jgi:hypothetical protein